MTGQVDQLAISQQCRHNVASRVALSALYALFSSDCGALEHAFAARLRKLATLRVKMLVLRRDPCVADKHTNSSVADENQV